MIETKDKNAGSPAVTANGADVLSEIIPAPAIQPDSRFRWELDQIERAVDELILDGRSLDVGGKATTKAQILGVLPAHPGAVRGGGRPGDRGPKGAPHPKRGHPGDQAIREVAEGGAAERARPGKSLAALVRHRVGPAAASLGGGEFISIQKSGKTCIVRFTLGKRQKQAVKLQGELQAQVVTPPAAK